MGWVARSSAIVLLLASLLVPGLFPVLLGIVAPALVAWRIGQSDRWGRSRAAIFGANLLLIVPVTLTCGLFVSAIAMLVGVAWEEALVSSVLVLVYAYLYLPFLGLAVLIAAFAASMPGRNRRAVLFAGAIVGSALLAFAMGEYLRAGEWYFAVDLVSPPVVLALVTRFTRETAGTAAIG